MMVLGTMIGTAAGVIPGLSSGMSVALLLQLTFTMAPLHGIIFLISVFVAVGYGGALTAILLNTPGSAMARRSKPICSAFGPSHWSSCPTGAADPNRARVRSIFRQDGHGRTGGSHLPDQGGSPVPRAAMERRGPLRARGGHHRCGRGPGTRRPEPLSNGNVCSA